MKKKLYFIDYSASDNYGLYVEKIKIALNNKRITYILPSNYKYSHDNTWKVFNYISNKIHSPTFQKIFKFFEMYFSFILIFMKMLTLIKTKKIIIISLYQPFNAFYFFLKIVKLTNSKIFIIVHDLVPFPSNYPKIIFTDQNKILGLSDGLIAHNQHSKIELEKFKKKVFKFRFPLLNDKKINPNKFYFKKNSSLKFLLLGHLRYEKGADLLIDAWKKYINRFPNSELIIAGAVLPGSNINIANLSSIKLISNYLDDDQYSDLIIDCDYGILPYRFGTNSGILSSFVAAGKPVINSNLDLFLDSPFTIKELTFKIEDGFNGLLEVLFYVSDNDYLMYKNKFCDYIKVTASEYENSFRNEILYSISQIENVN